jgi:hypothetical protein
MGGQVRPASVLRKMGARTPSYWPKQKVSRRDAETAEKEGLSNLPKNSAVSAALREAFFFTIVLVLCRHSGGGQ